MSWGQLLAILKEARQEAKANREAPLVECPYDGTPLVFRDGIANCPMGNYRSRRTTRDPVGP
jgi:hypothetical protein